MRRLMILFLICLLLAGSVLAVQPEVPFTDIQEGAYYYNAVLWAVDKNITAGMTDTTFVPGGQCTRAQAVTFLWRAAGSPEPTITFCPFTDVKEDAFYYKAMLWALEKDITQGITPTEFDPSGICTRAHVVTFLYRAADAKDEPQAECPFTDVKEGAFYYNAMLWALEKGITKGVTDTTFAPGSPCQRGQVVTFLHRYYSNPDLRPTIWTVTYELDGGKNAPQNPAEYQTGEEIPLRNASKLYHSFQGWYLDAEFTQKITKISETDSGNLTLYAKWEPFTYSITYQLNEGENHSDNPERYAYGSEIQLEEPNREGYDFAGWYLDADFTQPIDTIEPDRTGNLTLYAKWERTGLDYEAFSQLKPENVQKVLDFADRLYEENIQDDYIQANFTWDNATRSNNWIYFTGLMYESFLTTDFDRYCPETKAFYNQYIKEDGTISRYLAGELDAALMGVAMTSLLNGGALDEEETLSYQGGLNYIYHQLEKQTIYPEAGNLWLHSQKADGTPRPAWTKWNICLDGVYMSQLFLVRLAETMDAGNVEIIATNGDPVTTDAIWNDVYTRLVFVMENMKNPENGLLYHGYNVAGGFTNKASWSRGIGWYAMVLVEAAEKMPDPEKKAVLENHFRDLMDALLNYQDPYTFLWYNVTDGREEYAYRNGETVIYNIPESSGSAMFAYCLLRGYDSGILSDSRYRASSLRAFNALVELKMTPEGLTDVYTSSSVTPDKNMYQRNGYTTNDGKGVGPLILAANYAQ